MNIHIGKVIFRVTLILEHTVHGRQKKSILICDTLQVDEEKSRPACSGYTAENLLVYHV
jgi:hypothetical protein